jgi:shikimate dehydrogenase
VLGRRFILPGMTSDPLYFTAADLDRWAETGGLLQPPARLAVIGDPVAHSLSPEMHNPGLRALGIDAQYVRLHLKPEEFFAALPKLAALNFIGCNCTIPHKFMALEAVQEAHPAARRIGACNTLIFRPDGSLYGRNSDAPGFLRTVREEFGREVRDLRILVTGAGGGAGAAVATVCAMEGCRSLLLTNRTLEKAAEIAAGLSDLPGGAVTRAIPWTPPSMTAALAETDLIVNCTSLGMNAGDPEIVPHASLEARHLVFDMVYKPLTPPLVAAARAAGAQAVNGITMLLWQGVYSFEWWFGAGAPVAEMRRGLEEAVRRRMA